MTLDSRVSAKPPLVILCQHDRGSCAACCGAYNFVDRSDAASHARFARRTERVRAAWPDPVQLAAARDELLAAEKPGVLFAGVKVCPFAGYVEEERVGCLLHPSRHPAGADLRDLAVYPKEVCAGHFCAPHDWLRPREVALARAARGPRYGRVVTDAGLVKGVAALLDDARARRFDEADVARADDALCALWDALLDWPWRDPDPRRFGGFAFAGDDAVERALPSCLAGHDVAATSAHRAVLDALGTRLDATDDAKACLARLDALIADVASAMA